MPDFIYTATSLQSGQKKKGTVTAANKDEAEKKIAALFPGETGGVDIVFTHSKQPPWPIPDSTF